MIQQLATPTFAMRHDIQTLRAFTDLISDVSTGMALMAIGVLLIAQRRLGAIDLPVLIVRRELACMLISIATVRMLDVFARAVLWFDVLASGMRIAMAAITAVVALHAWQRFMQLYPKPKPGGEK